MDKKNFDGIKQVGELGSLGFSLVLSTAVGLALGVWLDRWLKFTSPWGTIFFLLFGIVAGFWNIIQAIYPKRKG